MEIGNQVIAITGASAGIGVATARLVTAPGEVCPSQEGRGLAAIALRSGLVLMPRSPTNGRALTVRPSTKRGAK
jgi:NAD(P)-dependent dehydrogenase (short-subunit alcohol dehydrogenase family)